MTIPNIWNLLVINPNLSNNYPNIVTPGQDRKTKMLRLERRGWRVLQWIGAKGYPLEEGNMQVSSIAPRVRTIKLPIPMSEAVIVNDAAIGFIAWTKSRWP